MRFMIAAILIIAVGAGVYFFAGSRRSQNMPQSMAIAVDLGDKKKAFVESRPQTDISKWMGAAPADLYRVFQNSESLGNVKKESPESQCEVANWFGWPKVGLTFTAGALSEAAFESAYLLTEAEAVKIVTDKFGVGLPKVNYFSTPQACGYDSLSGNVRTVKFLKDSQASSSIRSIVLVFK